MNKGPKDKYTNIMVQDRLSRLLDEMDITDDEYIAVFMATTAFTSAQLQESLNALTRSPTSKIKTLATELLANWQPEPEIAFELPQTPTSQSTTSPSQSVIKKSNRPLLTPPTLVERLATLQNMILQSMEPDSDFTKWVPTSKHESKVKSFTEQLRLALPNNEFQSFTTALRNMDVNNGSMLNSLFEKDSFKAVKQLYKDNIQFLEELNRDFQKRATAQISKVTSESIEDDILDIIEPVFAGLTQEKNARAAQKSSSERTTALGNSQLVIGNMLDNPEKTILVDPANEKTMNGDGGVSGAIKAMYQTKKLLKSYVRDLLKFPEVGGKRCPNGEVKHTFTGGIDVIHTSAPDLREKKNRQVGSQTEPSEEAKEKLYQAYYNAFRMAHNLNSNDSSSKPISCPLLGAGIFKWPAELSAEIAGKAITDFRDKYGNDLQINLYARPEDLKNGLTEEKLNEAISKGEASFKNSKTAQSNLDELKTIAEIQQFIDQINSYKDRSNVLNPLATKLQKIIDSKLPDNSKLWESNLLIQSTLAKAGTAARANIDLALDTISFAREGKIKVNKLDFAPDVVKEDMHGREQHEYRKQKEKVSQELPSIEDLKDSPLRTVYVTVTYSEKSKLDYAKRAFNKITKQTSLHYLEAASKVSPDLLPTTTDPTSAIEWAEQLQEDLIGEQATEKVIVVSIQVPEILFQARGTGKQERGNYLDTNLMQKLVATKEGKSLLKINQAAIYTEFDITKEQAQQSHPVPVPSAPISAPQPVKIDGVKQAKLNFISSFQDKINKLPDTANGKIVRAQMLRDLNNYANSTDSDIKSKAAEVLANYNQSQLQQSSEDKVAPQILLPREVMLKDNKKDFATIEGLSLDLIDNMIGSEAFDAQSESSQTALLEMAKFLRSLTDKVNDFIKGDINLGQLMDFVKSNGIPDADRINPLQVLVDGITELATALNITDPNVKNNMNDLRQEITSLSSKLNLPLHSQPLNLQSALVKPTTSEPSLTSKSSLNVNVQKLYEQMRSTSIDRNTTLNAFARNAVKRITRMKNADRDMQIAGIQALVDNVNGAKDPQAKETATRDLVFALQYVKSEIKNAQKKLSLVSALDIVCDKIMENIPNKNSYHAPQGEVISKGKAALNKAAPIEQKLEDKSKDRPSH